MLKIAIIEVACKCKVRSDEQDSDTAQPIILDVNGKPDHTA